MNNYGFIKVSGCIPIIKLANINYNSNKIIEMIFESEKKGSTIAIFPELSLTGYTCQDLFQNIELLNSVLDNLQIICEKTKDLDILSIVGAPIINNNSLYNCAVIINKGNIIGIVPKINIPNYKEFYERRWFSDNINYNTEIVINNKKIPFGNNLIFINKNNVDLKIGVEICEDLWVLNPPSNRLISNGASIICNLSASNIIIGKYEYRRDLVKMQSAKGICGYIYVSAGIGESTTDLVFDGHSIIAENGIILQESNRFLREDQIIYSEIDIEKIKNERIKITTFSNNFDCKYIEFNAKEKEFKLNRYIDPHPFVPKDITNLEQRCKEIFSIQCAGLCKRLESIPDSKVIIGVSGGLDSTLALLVAIKSFYLINKNIIDIITVTLPGFGTSNKTYNNIKKLCNYFKTNFLEIDIKDLSNNVYDKIEHNSNNYDIVFENVQARIRTLLLMSLANKYNGIVLGTGDLSEIATGWSTYNGDHISMYNVNATIPKTLVKFLVQWIAENEIKDTSLKNILIEITNQPISPELIPDNNKNIISQKTEEIIGPFELIDFFIYHFVRNSFSLKKILFLANIAFADKYNCDTIKKWLKIFINRFVKNQWKRDCVPAGPKVGTVDLSPRGSWRMSVESDINEFINNL